MSSKCDVTSGEVLLLSIDTNIDLRTCKILCENNELCSAITHFESGSCDLYSTSCGSTRFDPEAISFWVLRPLTTTEVPTTVPAFFWIVMGISSVCDTAMGEVLISASADIANLQACKNKCINDAECESITYFDESGQCNLYRTTCGSTTFEIGATAYSVLRLDSAFEDKESTTAAPPIATPSTSTKVVANTASFRKAGAVAKAEKAVAAAEINRIVVANAQSSREVWEAIATAKTLHSITIIMMVLVSTVIF